LFLVNPTLSEKMSSEESEGQLFGGTQLSESPEISLGEQQSVEQESYGLEEELARMEEVSSVPDEDTGRGQEASSSGPASGTNPQGYTRGAWKGSDVNQAKIDWLY
jgi:hypothetical protein